MVESLLFITRGGYIHEILAPPVVIHMRYARASYELELSFFPRDVLGGHTTCHFSNVRRFAVKENKHYREEETKLYREFIFKSTKKLMASFFFFFVLLTKIEIVPYVTQYCVTVDS